MAVIVPSSDTKNYAKSVEVSAVATAVAAASGTALTALQQHQYRTNMEMVISLMATYKLSPLTILSTCSYNT